MEVSRLVESLASRFVASGVDNPKRVAEELIAHVFQCRPLEIYTGAIPTDAATAQEELTEKLEPLARRIEEGEPLHYVIGSTEFWGLEMTCDPRALIPRPETELLVEEVLSSRIWNHTPATVVDVGTGTGCIVITLAKHRQDAHFKAVDISPQALDLARENAARHGVKEKILWLENSLLERFAPESCDAVVANLPYITSDDWKELPASVRNHEPKSALDSGPSGLKHINELATQARYVLVPRGMLFLEFGYDQGDAVYQLLDRLGYLNIEIKRDLAGHDRIAVAENP
jgi:release factor glutamine methyltransferase